MARETGFEVMFDERNFKRDLKKYLQAYGAAKYRKEYEAACEKFQSVIQDYYNHYTPRYRYQDDHTFRVDKRYVTMNFGRSYDVLKNIVTKEWKNHVDRIVYTVEIDPNNTYVKNHPSWSTKNPSHKIGGDVVAESVLEGRHGFKGVMAGGQPIPVMTPSPYDILKDYVDKKGYESDEIEKYAIGQANSLGYNTFFVRS